MDNNVTAAQIKSTSVSSDNIYVNGEELSSYINSHFQSGVQVSSYLSSGTKIASIQAGTNTTDIYSGGSGTTIQKLSPDLYSSPESFKDGILPVGGHDAVDPTNGSGMYYFDGKNICESNLKTGDFRFITRVSDSVIGFDGFLALKGYVAYKSADGKTWEVLKSFEGTTGFRPSYAQIEWDSVNHAVIINYNVDLNNTTSDYRTLAMTTDLTTWTEIDDSHIWIGSMSAGPFIKCYNGKLYIFYAYTADKKIIVLTYSNGTYVYEKTVTIDIPVYNIPVYHHAQFNSSENGIALGLYPDDSGATSTGLYYIAYLTDDGSTWNTVGFDWNYGTVRSVLPISGNKILVATAKGYFFQIEKGTSNVTVLGYVSGWNFESITQYGDVYYVIGRGKYNDSRIGTIHKWDGNAFEKVTDGESLVKAYSKNLFNEITTLASGSSTADIITKVNAILTRLQKTQSLYL